MSTLAPFSFEHFVVACVFLGDTAAFALGDGNVRFCGASSHVTRAHEGGLLAAVMAQDGQSLISGGDDGRVVQTTADGQTRELASRPRKWIDILASGPQGAVAFASGRTAWVRLKDGTEKEFAHARAIGGLAFAPKGLRLACARYDGVDLYWINTATAPSSLSWKGAHSEVIFSPDGKYVVTSMPENALHGWRLADSQDMRMTGYPGKVKSVSWSAKGRYLATSGASAAILWPFFGKTGPMGQQPLQLGVREDAMVCQVACHPAEDMVAIGYRDGMIMAARMSDGAEVLLRRPGEAPVSALCWDASGLRLAFGCENGEAGIVTVSA